MKYRAITGMMPSRPAAQSSTSQRSRAASRTLVSEAPRRNSGAGRPEQGEEAAHDPVISRKIFSQGLRFAGLAAQLVQRAAGADSSLMDDGDAVAELFGDLHDVVEIKRVPPRAQWARMACLSRVGGARVQAGHGLVEDEHPRLDDQGAAEHDLRRMPCE